MKQLVTTGIILSRTDYGEADRILTLLTPDYGKLRLVARGVRRVKSKLAGGIELFSVSDITFIRGRSELGTLVSARLIRHYGRIPQDLEKTMLAYELIKRLNRLTEDEAGPEYFGLLKDLFEALDDRQVSKELAELWFTAQLLRLGGLRPNLETDTDGRKLTADQRYDFSLENMVFAPARAGRGRFGAAEIKLLRLATGEHPARLLAQVQGLASLLETTAPLLRAIAKSYLHV